MYSFTLVPTCLSHDSLLVVATLKKPSTRRFFHLRAVFRSLVVKLENPDDDDDDDDDGIRNQFDDGDAEEGRARLRFRFSSFFETDTTGSSL